MKFEITKSVADKIVIDFLSENGFGKNITIQRHFTSPNQIITDICHTVIYHGEPVKEITRIKSYNQLLCDILNLRGYAVNYVSTKIKQKTISLLIDSRDFIEDYNAKKVFR